MKKDIDQIKFNLTSDMVNLLLKFNSFKKEYNETKDEELLKELDSIRKEFIDKFRLNNKKEIEEYLKIKGL